MVSTSTPFLENSIPDWSTYHLPPESAEPKTIVYLHNQDKQAKT